MSKIGTRKSGEQGNGGRRLSSQAMKKRLRERLTADTQQVLKSDIVSIFRKQGYYEELPLDELQDRLSKLQSALVKRYSMERGTRVVNKLMVKRGKVAILPMWSVTDFYSALSVRAQQGEITRDDCYSVLYKFEMEASQGLFQFISPTMETYLAAKELILDYPALRSPQLLHLALALELKPLRLTVVSADKQLLAACRPAGLHIINPEDD